MTVLFVFAHPDDEAFGPAGTIAKFTSSGTPVVVATLCNGARHDDTKVAKARQKAFKASCKALGASAVIFDTPDLTLTYRSTVSAVEGLVTKYEPDMVFTHSISDVHTDHKTVAEACLVACRPKVGSSVNALYACEVPPSTDWAFGHPTSFSPSTYIDVSQFMELKEHVLSLYDTETYDWPDGRSVKAMITRAEFRGAQAGFPAAESFQLIFQRMV